MAGFLMIKRKTMKPLKRLVKPPLDYKRKGRISLIILYNFQRLAKKFSLMKIYNNAYTAVQSANKIFSDDVHGFSNTFATLKVTKDAQPKADVDYNHFKVYENENEEFFKACQRSAKKIAMLKISKNSGSIEKKEFESKKVICKDSLDNIPAIALGEIKENREKKVPQNLSQTAKNNNELEKQKDSKTNLSEKLMEKNSEKQEEGNPSIKTQAIKDFRFSFGEGKKVRKYIFNPGKELIQLKPNKRNILLDGSNVAFAHGRRWFSSKGLEVCMTYFSEMGHDVKAVVSSFRRNAFQSTDHKILEKWYKKGNIVFTPLKNFPDRKLASYDDRFILQLACEWNAAVVSNNKYKNVMNESAAFKMIVKTRVLGFSWCDDLLILVKDPAPLN